MDGVAPLDKGAAIVGETLLAMNADKLTELAIITLKEHYRRLGKYLSGFTGLPFFRNSKWSMVCLAPLLPISAIA